jgi:hypothetical protein
MSTISIFNKTDINHIFIRANSAILSQYKELFNELTTPREKQALLEELWKKEYNVTIIKELDTWSGLKFDSDHAMFVFQLRWG